VRAPERGFNASSKPAGIGSYNVSHLVDDVVGLVSHLQKERGDTAGSKVHVLGHDWGGPVAWLVAGWHPEITNTLTIINGPHPSVFIDELRHGARDRHTRYLTQLIWDSVVVGILDLNMCQPLSGGYNVMQMRSSRSVLRTCCSLTPH
jgi:pimeloyl-ACP methyl ester carboxylesterase